MNERWLPVVGWEGLYEVSDRGRVRSLDRLAAGRNQMPRLVRGRTLRYRPLPTGYLRVLLSDKGHRDDALVHRLVLDAFVGPCPDGMEACHKDSDRSNNWLSNLRWDTRLGNCQDIIARGSHANTRKMECPRGHRYDAVRNGWKSTLTGQRKKRICRACRNENARAAYQRRKVAA